MKISVLCSSRNHPVYAWLERWRQSRQCRDEVELAETSTALKGGDVLFLVSCGEMIVRTTRDRYRAVLVLHASDLPEGQGWSPHVWQILQGRNRIAVTLLAAEDAVDTGLIWGQEWVEFGGHELHDEINEKIFAAELRLMDHAADHFDAIVPRAQDGRPPTRYRKRVPEDSRLDPEKSLAEQFDLLRICDPQRFPVFFDYRGQRYLLRIEKAPGTGHA
jgi:methionyl-tRNA formyltransferase